MKKQGFHYYTWYPKDWQTSDSVFNLTLEERAVYREFIDRAYLENNAIPATEKSWARLWNVSEEKLMQVIKTLIENGLITLSENLYSVPSCESRLILKNTGRAGGKTKGKLKGIAKGSSKGMVKGLPNQTEQTEQTEREKPDDRYYKPSEQEAIKFFDEKGYSEKQAKHFFTHYNSRDWCDTNGKPVEFWKVKAHGWFDEKEKKDNAPMSNAAKMHKKFLP